MELQKQVHKIMDSIGESLEKDMQRHLEAMLKEIETEQTKSMAR